MTNDLVDVVLLCIFVVVSAVQIQIAQTHRIGWFTAMEIYINTTHETLEMHDQ
jgi:hypothetical protein